MDSSRRDILLLFDIDGTLTVPRSTIEDEFERFLYEEIKPRTQIGVVTGADLDKIYEQLNGPKILQQFDFVFPENGLVQIAGGVEVFKQNIVRHLGEATIQRFINYVLTYLGHLELPIKRGTFLEFRNGMMNICPMGRQCAFEERQIFADFDRKHNIRNKMIEDLKREFKDVDLTYSIGGQISFDIYPKGWDKSYCLDYLVGTGQFKAIHFFGDKTDPGGNDHEIFTDSRTIGHRVNNPHETMEILCEMFNLNKSGKWFLNRSRHLFFSP